MSWFTLTKRKYWRDTVKDTGPALGAHFLAIDERVQSKCDLVDVWKISANQNDWLPLILGQTETQEKEETN